MIKKSFLMSLTTLFLLILGLVNQYFLARYLSMDQYGLLQIIFSWLAIFSLFSLNSFNNVVTKSVAQKYKVFFKTANLFGFFSSFLGSIILLIIGFWWKPEWQDFFLLLAIFLPFYAGINLSESFYLGAGKFGKYSLLAIISNLLSLTGQILAVYFFRQVELVLLVSLFFTSLVNVIVTILIWQSLKEEKKDNNKEKELIHYGFSLTLINVIAIISARLQYIILAILASPSAVAIYAVAQIIPEKIKSVFKSFLNPFSVYLATNDKNKSLRLVKNSLLVLFLFGVIVTLIGLIILPIVINLVFSDKYREAIIYSEILFSLSVFVPLNAILSSIIVYHGYKKFYTQLTIFSGIVQIILFLILIPLYQIWGIIISLVASNILTIVVNLIWFYFLPTSRERPLLASLNCLTKKNSDYENIIITSDFTGDNITKILAVDFLNSTEKYPIWIRILAKLSNTKKI